MAYTFTDGPVATAAQLNTLLPPIVPQAGLVVITPVASTPTSVRVTFPQAYASAPKVTTSPVTIYPGTVVKGTSVSDVTATGFTLWIYRTNTTATTVSWQAWGTLAEQFVDGEPAWATLLNAGVGGLVAKSGVVTITPTSADVPKSSTVTFAAAFTSAAVVTITPSSTVAGGNVYGWSVTEMSATGFKAWLTRANTTATDLQWVALGRV